MLFSFFETLRLYKIPTSIGEYLDLLAALKMRLVFVDVEKFYYLSRMLLIKDERHYDKFDRAFNSWLSGINNTEFLHEKLIPENWLGKSFEKIISEKDKEKIKSLGSLEKLMEEFSKRLQEQQKRHQGGNKWIGTGGTSPFGSWGYNPQGIRIGQSTSQHRHAIKVWDKRQFKNFDHNQALTTRNFTMVFRQLRKFARQGESKELDIDATINETAKKGGLLKIIMRPERKNNVKLLLLMDVGGTMDEHISLCETLFASVANEFKHLEYYYFHNCIYESLWKNNDRRLTEKYSTFDILNKYTGDYKVIIAGDASMSPYEIISIGGSVEHWNPESGAVWLNRLMDIYPYLVWLNPISASYWNSTESTTIIRQLTSNRMFPLTLKGVTDAITCLNSRK